MSVFLLQNEVDGKFYWLVYSSQKNKTSADDLKRGVPQGKVLGRLLFST